MNKDKHSKNNLIIQGSILAIASLIVRLIGFFYRVPLANIIGDEGSGYYTVAFSIYTFFLMLSTYGFPSAISKLNSALLIQKKYRQSHQLIKSAVYLALLVGLFFSLLMWFGAGTIARIYENENIVWSIKALAPALFIFSVMSVLRGYFQGFNTMMPTAISQIVEQIFNAIFSVVMAYLLVSKGTEFGAAGGTLGTGIGALFGLIVMMVVYYGARKTVIKRWYENEPDSSEPTVSMIENWKIILSTSIPLVTGTLITYFLAIVDTFMLNKSMISNGFAPITASEYVGVYGMKYLLIINLPIIAISSSLTSSLIPSISTSAAVNDIKAIKDKSRAVFKIAMIILIPAFIGEAVFARPIISLLFDSNHTDLAANLIYFGSISIVLVGATNIIAGVLIGLNKLRQHVYTTIFAGIMKVILLVVFLYVLDLHVYGLILSNISYNIILIVGKFYFAHRDVGTLIDIRRSIILPFVSAILMGVFGYSLYTILGLLFNSTNIPLLITIPISAFAYGIAIIKFNVINESEILGIPKGDKIIVVLRKLHIL